ncbi:hypothetical protein RYX36_026321, partial [Vicia faba]
KVSPPQFSSSSATYSPSASLYISYAAVNRLSCSPVSLGFPIGVRSGAVKGDYYTGKLHGSPGFLYRCGFEYETHWPIGVFDELYNLFVRTNSFICERLGTPSSRFCNIVVGFDIITFPSRS